MRSGKVVEDDINDRTRQLIGSHYCISCLSTDKVQGRRLGDAT